METPNPRAQIGGIAEKLDGRRLLSVEAVGKNLLFRFEGGSVPPQPPADERPLDACAPRRRGARPPVARSPRLEGRGAAVERAGARAPRAGIPGLGPDILELPPRLDEMAARIRRGDARSRGRRRDPRPAPRRRDREQMEGGGALGGAGLSLAGGLGASDEQLQSVLEAAARMMRGSLDGRPRREPRLPPRRSAVPAVRRANRLARPGRRQPDGVLVSCLPAIERRCRFALRTSTTRCARSVLRRFAQLGPEVEQGAGDPVRRSTAAQPGSRIPAADRRPVRPGPTRSRSSRTHGSPSPS